MNFLEEKYYQTRLSKSAIDKAYELAHKEIKSTNIRERLMARAKSIAGDYCARYLNGHLIGLY